MIYGSNSRLTAVRAVLSVAACLRAVSASYSFLALGDWGGAAITEYTHNVVAVAAEMVNIAKAAPPAFIVNTGDNFYWCGIQSTTDYQVNVDWVEPYSASQLQIPWYSVLGNHEYGYNVDAQLELHALYGIWIMDDRYYTRRVLLDDDSSTYLTMIFLDTSPCVSDYRADNPEYWDPCGTEYPTCSLEATDDDFEGECLFHSNIIGQSCTDQYNWFSAALNSVPTDDWLVVVGHHPIDEVDVYDFTSLLQKRGFSLYLNGHAHVLTHYTIDKTGAYVTSGAGSMVNTPDQAHTVTAAKVRGEDVNATKSTSHTYQTVYSNKTAGFTQHTFSSDFSTLTTNFISYAGDVIHTFTVNKAGSYV